MLLEFKKENVLLETYIDNVIQALNYISECLISSEYNKALTHTHVTLEYLKNYFPQRPDDKTNKN